MANAKESIEMMNEFNTSGYDSFRQLTDIGLKTWNYVMDAQLTTLNTVMNNGMEQFKLMTESKDYHTALRGQMDLTRKLGEDLMTQTRDVIEQGQKTGEEYRGWYETNMASINEKINKVAEKAA
ncbi:MAG: phasin family protein [Candidatus Thiodiazotropha sp.]